MATSIENSENKLCDYGCGQIARFQFGNGKLCCSDNYIKCCGQKDILSNAQKGKRMPTYILIENQENKLCDYGCGQIAKYKTKSGKLCCSDHFKKCPVEKEKNRSMRKGKINSTPIEIENLDGIICDYGCGQIAKYKTKTGKYCCSRHYSNCEYQRKQNSNRQEGKQYSKFQSIENYENKLCEYGCGQIAKFKSKVNGKLCCSDYYRKCPNERKKLSEKTTGYIYEKPEIFENSDNLLCEFGCGQIAKFKFKNDRICCESHYMKCPAERGKRIVIKEKSDNILCEFGCGKIAAYEFGNGRLCCSEHWSQCDASKLKLSKAVSMKYSECMKKYPELVKIENLIEGPNGEILGHCKNSNCKCSVENGEYFVLTTIQLWERNRGINSINDGNYFYCCEECKKECILFGNSAIKLDNIVAPKGNLNQASTQDLSIWRNEVFTRQLKDNPTHLENFCEICHKIENLVGHHILPQKLYPEFALDPDNGIVLCSECHTKYGHRKGTECSTGYLGNMNCE